MGEKVTTPKFRANFVHVFKPKRHNDGKERYEVLAAFEVGADMADLKSAAVAACKDKFGDKYETVMKHPNFKSPFKKQEDQVDRDGNLRAGMTEGAICISIGCNADQGRPIVLDEKLNDIHASDEFRSGDYARAIVDCFAYDHPTGGRGVSFALESLQRAGRGEALGGGQRADPRKKFAPIALDDDQAGSETEDASGLI